MSGVTDKTFIINEDSEWTVTSKKDGSLINLTGYTITLKFNNEDPDGTDFTKVNTDGVGDTDWIEIVSAAAGTFKVKIASPPVSVPTDEDSVYTVGASVVKAGVRDRFGSARWEFLVPPEGPY